jgi:hypothetical protein
VRHSELNVAKCCVQHHGIVTPVAALLSKMGASGKDEASTQPECGVPASAPTKGLAMGSLDGPASDRRNEERQP